MNAEVEELLGWRVSPTSFSPKEAAEVTGASQSAIRLWRSRGYLPENELGRWAKHDSHEVMSIYLLNAFSKLGVAPSEAGKRLQALGRDLFFFAVTSGDGACDFVGPRPDVEALRTSFDDSFTLPREVCRPVDERRFLLSEGGPDFRRQADLQRAIEEEQLTYFYCIDLVAAGRTVAARAKKPLLTFIQEKTEARPQNVRLLSHGQK